MDDLLEIPLVHLSVDDKTRHFLYFRAQPRTDEERLSSIHKSDMGGGSVSCTTTVHNGRGKEHDLTLDEASFELVDCPTALTTEEFYSIQQQDAENSVSLRENYYDEVSSFIKKKLGCDSVICFHSQVRNVEKTGTGGIQGYAGGGPHTDSSAVSADELALSMAKNNDDGPYQRYLYLNLWRNISDEPIENDHLAMLDERTTVKPDDYIPKDLFGDDYNVVQYGLNARHASNHKWYYFPQMKKDEAVLFKQMDSDWTKTSRICFHMSVSDPNTKVTKSRESIELRMMCFWKEASVNSMPTEENTNSEMIRDPLEVAKELSNPSSFVESASAWQLTRGLLRKIPLLGYLVPSGSSGGEAAVKYSGSPQDYLAKFVGVVDSFPSWPSFAVSWIKGQMKQSGRGKEDEAIAAITKALVDDSLGYQGTKTFKPDEKKEIVNFLIQNEKYMETAKKHWADLAQD